MVVGCQRGATVPLFQGLLCIVGTASQNPAPHGSGLQVSTVQVEVSQEKHDCEVAVACTTSSGQHVGKSSIQFHGLQSPHTEPLDDTVTWSAWVPGRGT